MPICKHPQAARMIRKARYAAGLTQQELAEKLGVSLGTVGRYENGTGFPKTGTLFMLCTILDIRPVDILRADNAAPVKGN